MNVLKEYVCLYDSEYFIADLFGGRGGARSYALTQRALYNILHKKNSRAFFLREIHSTIYTSLWTDFKDRITEYNELHNTDLSSIIIYTDNKSGENTAINTSNGNTITTKGFKVSSGNQTANLKSLAGATDVYIDEFDEVEKADYSKLKLSLRKKGVELKIIRAFNPPYAEHSIWEDYDLIKISNKELLEILVKHSSKPIGELKRMVERNSKTYYTATTKHKNHIFVNSTFINNYENLNKIAIDEYEKLLDEDFHYYCVTILGLIPNVDGEVVYNDYSDVNNSFETIKEFDVLNIGMDFNITKMCATVRVSRGKEKHVVDEFVDLYDTHQMCSEIKKRYPEHKIIVTSDASGKSRSTSGASDWNIIKSFKFGTQDLTSNPKVRDRVNEINTGFRRKDIFINKDLCPYLHKALVNQKYKKGEPDKTSGYDHILEAFGYDIYAAKINIVKVRSSSVL